MEHITGDQRWAVLLCKVPGQDTPVAHKDRNYFVDLFVNNSPNGLNRYWRDASHNTISLDGSQVFGWVDLPDSFTAIMVSLQRIAEAAVFFSNLDPENEAFVDFRQFDGILVVTDVNLDLRGYRLLHPLNLNGEVRPYRLVFCCQDHAHAEIAHEMGHAFGLDHSFDTSTESHSPNNDGRPGAYGDRWDIMSAMVRLKTFNRPPYGAAGPLLNAVNMSLLGWLAPARTYTLDRNNNSATIKLRPLNRPDLPGYLAAKVGSIFVEFRSNNPSTRSFTNWDEGLDRSAVFVHSSGPGANENVVGDTHSILLKGITTFLNNEISIQDLQTGNTIELGDPGWPYTAYTRIEVMEIDNNNLSATVRFTWHAARPEPVNVGVLQWIIQGIIGLGPDGGIVKIPPRQPVNDILVGLAMYELANHIEDAEEQLAAQRHSMRMIAQISKKIGGKP